jgi:hypothetical protein
MDQGIFMLSSKLINRIRAEYGAKIVDKHRFVFAHSLSFMEERFHEDKFNALVAGTQITDIIHNYFVDVLRFKERRGMDDGQDFVTCGKVAAFTCKWIIKLRPILVEPIQGKMDSLSLEERFNYRYANEIFAIEHAERIISKHIGVDFSLPARLRNELRYDFRQKKFSETQLYMIFEHAMGYYADN